MAVIKTENITKRFKDLVAVDNLDLEINEGEIFALLGVNGAGKTTTIKMLTGLLKPTEGNAFVFSKSIITDMESIKEDINMSPQETAVAPNLSVYENLEFIGSVYKVENLQEKIEDTMKKFKLEEVRNNKAKTLSGGYQRRLSIAMALISEPKILFLDEPTLGLDVLARRELWGIIEGLKNKITIILTTHYMEEAENLADKVGIMAKGKLLTVATPEDLVKSTASKNFEDAFVKVVSGGEY